MSQTPDEQQQERTTRIVKEQVQGMIAIKRTTQAALRTTKTDYKNRKRTSGEDGRHQTFDASSPAKDQNELQES